MRPLPQAKIRSNSVKATFLPALFTVFACSLSLTDALAEDMLDTVSLPKDSTKAPALWLNAKQLGEMRSRCKDSKRKKQLASFAAYVKKQWPGLPKKANDDLTAKVAKTAGLLCAMKQTAVVDGVKNYGEIALQAIALVGSRRPRQFMAGKGVINVLQDSGRLQSLAEAYDLSTGPQYDKELTDKAQAKLANWADALLKDVNLTGAFGIPGHRDNWGIKAGSALVTTALTIPKHKQAAKWLQYGQLLINESLDKVFINGGWWGEGPHYLNYSLNNLASTCYHVKNRTGVDWFKALRPLVKASLAMRLPSGGSSPFEEGIEVAFPHHMLAPAYPKLGPVMMWAWNTGSKAIGSYNNQQYHAVSQFLIVDESIQMRAPRGAKTRFVGGDSHAHALRTSWEKDGSQLTMLTAKDFQSRTMVASRHNMQNPLDLTLFGAGHTVLVTGSGGPLITRSKRRGYYLKPSSKNIPLIGDSAPFIVDPTQIQSRYQLATKLEDKESSKFFECGQSLVAPYASAKSMSRAIALVDNGYFVVATAVKSDQVIQFSTPWRGRGTCHILTKTNQFTSSCWSYKKSTLHSAFASSIASKYAISKGFYGSRWNKEEELDVGTVSATGKNIEFVGAFQVQGQGQKALIFGERSKGGASLTVTGDGWIDTILAGNLKEAKNFGTMSLTGELAVIRRIGKAVSGGGFMATSIFRDGRGWSLKGSQALTLSFTATKKGVAVTVLPSLEASWSLSLGPFTQVRRALRYKAKFEGQALGKSAFKKRGQTLEFKDLTGPGTILISR
jgi:hypothetical protein